MKITEHEMRGLLSGKALPGDTRLNEDLPVYLMRKFDELQQKLDAAEAKIKQLEWDSVFIPKNIESALAVVGMALPESKEEFNFHINRWIQRLVDRVVRLGPELDAERNNLRAEGAMAARNHIRKTLTAFHYEYHGAVAECADMAEMVAERLRSGTHDTADKAG